MHTFSTCVCPCVRVHISLHANCSFPPRPPYTWTRGGRESLWHTVTGIKSVYIAVLKEALSELWLWSLMLPVFPLLMGHSLCVGGPHTNNHRQAKLQMCFSLARCTVARCSSSSSLAVRWRTQMSTQIKCTHNILGGVNVKALHLEDIIRRLNWKAE